VNKKQTTKSAAGGPGLSPINKPRCGLCGKGGKLMQTECCGNWICNDHDNYVLFSYARNSCARNHDRYTLCSYHYHEGHEGEWKTCPKCRADFEYELEMYVYYGTNEYNFEKLPTPPAYKPTHCATCGLVIRLGEGGYSHGPKGYQCQRCTDASILNYDDPAGVDDGAAAIGKGYRPPMDRLLDVGEPRDTNTDYMALGINRGHVAELVRMATDEELHFGPWDSKVVWAPVHAWRALAQLRAEEAVVPLLSLLRRVDEEYDDWVCKDLPCALAAIGPGAIAPLAQYLADSAHGQWARVASAKALGLLGMSHPEARAECVAKLRAQLERFDEQTECLNAFLISPLLDLRAVETAPVMGKAFASGSVDESVVGDWEDAQIELGLKTRREHARKPTVLTKLADDLRTAAAFAPLLAPPKTGRNDPCPCGSGKKFKKCCGR
jgi:hypothetical protein